MSIRTRIYIKVSTDNQRNNDFSIDSQLRILKEHCEKTITILLVYIMIMDTQYAPCYTKTS